MKMAIATETSKHPSNRSDYKVWYLEVTSRGDVVGIGVVTREELVKEVFQTYRRTGKSGWRVFKKGEDHSEPIEIYDFISQNSQENTHFGNLPTLAQFQETLMYLQSNLELRSIAS